MTKIKTLAITALGSMLIWNAAAQNLILNGDFEDPNIGTTSTSYGPGVTTLTGWTISGDGIQFFSASVSGVTGSQCVQMTLNYVVPAILSQTIATTPGAYYTMRVGVAERTGTAVNGTAKFGDTVQPFSFPGGTHYTNVTFVAAATSSSTTVEIDGGNPNDASMLFVIDDVSVVRLSDTNGIPVLGKTVSLQKSN